MEAKDTGWTYTLVCRGCNKPYEETRTIENPYPEPHYCSNCLVIFKAGIKEVVEEIETYNHQGIRMDGYPVVKDCVLIGQPDWQAKLKEWGLQENKLNKRGK